MKFKMLPLAALLGLAITACNSGPAAEKPAATAAPAATSATPPAAAKKRLLFFGNSLTAGLGVEPEQAFAGLIGQRIDSLKLPYEVINAGLSGETTAGGRSRVGWILRQPVDIFVLELGANDGLRGLPLRADRKSTRLNSSHPVSSRMPSSA